jgi:hypothetical protein
MNIYIPVDLITYLLYNQFISPTGVSYSQLKACTRLVKIPWSKDEFDEILQLQQTVKPLVKAAEICIEELEVQANIVRTLSVLSDRPECGESLAENAERLGIILSSVIQMCPEIEKGLAIINRLGYILGNIMARWDKARDEFYNNDAAIESLITALEYYSNKQLLTKGQYGDTCMDVLVKIIRVVANLTG